MVFEQDLERDNATADPGLLSNLSSVTAEFGGRTLAAEEFPQLLRELEQQPLDLDVTTWKRTNYWDTWPFFLLFVALISTEWYVRKRWGLV